jgi:serine/threonine protein kinase
MFSNLERLKETYNVISRLGRGTFGEVFLIQNINKPEDLMAMKVLKKKDMIDQGIIKYTISERDILK